MLKIFWIMINWFILIFAQSLLGINRKFETTFGADNSFPPPLTISQSGNVGQEMLI